MPTNSQMIQQNIRVEGSLICPLDDRIYYIAREQNNGNARRIHGFLNNGTTWTSTVSPSWSANSNGMLFKD